MSIITIYPLISDVASEDLLVISDTSKEGNPTKSVSMGQISNYVGSAAGITLTTNGTANAATLINNVLNIPVYAGGGTATPVATSVISGTSKLFSDTEQSTVSNAVTNTALRTYGVQFNSAKQMVVNVPWAALAITAATTVSLGTIKLDSATPQVIASNAATAVAGRTYPVQLNATDNASVNVPWTTPVAATTTVDGIVKLISNTVQSTAASSLTTTALRTYGIQFDSSGRMVVNVPWVSTTAVTATTSVLGVVKLSSDLVQPVSASIVTTVVNRSYGVQFDSGGKMVINAPWTDTISAVATSAITGTSKLWSDSVQLIAPANVFNTASRTYGVQINNSGQMVVNVPWAGTSVSTATATVLGAVKLGSNTTQIKTIEAVTTTTGRTYGVQLNATDQMVVNVPWNATGAGAQYITPTALSLSAAQTVNLSDVAYAAAAMIELSWVGGNGTAVVNLPSAASSTNRVLRLISNSDYALTARHADITPSGTDVLDGAATAYRINKSYEGIQVWSNGTEWFILQKKA